MGVFSPVRPRLANFVAGSVDQFEDCGLVVPVVKNPSNLVAENTAIEGFDTRFGVSYCVLGSDCEKNLAALFSTEFVHVAVKYGLVENGQLYQIRRVGKPNHTISNTTSTQARAEAVAMV